MWSLCLINLGNEDPLSAYPELEGEEKDSMALLNEILGSMSVDEGDFSREWTEVFGDAEEGTSAASGRGPAEAQQKESSFFLPSQLLDQSLNNQQSSVSGLNITRLCVHLCLCESDMSEPEREYICPNRSSIDKRIQNETTWGFQH